MCGQGEYLDDNLQFFCFNSSGGGSVRKLIFCFFTAGLFNGHVEATDQNLHEILRSEREPKVRSWKFLKRFIDKMQ